MELLGSIMNIDKLIDLTKQLSYRISKGFTREEKRMFILDSIQKEGER